MSFNTEGIIFRQTRMVQGRRMILLFTKEYGKISVGSNIGDKGRSSRRLLSGRSRTDTIRYMKAGIITSWITLTL